MPAKKNGVKKTPGNKRAIECHPIIGAKPTFGQKAADKLTIWAGSWTFIILFLIIIALWVYANVYLLLTYGKKPFDPFPFILLNLALSLLAALQAPIILMSQNRQTQKDRIRTEYDYATNRRAEREIKSITKQLNRIENKLPRKRR